LRLSVFAGTLALVISNDGFHAKSLGRKGREKLFAKNFPRAFKRVKMKITLIGETEEGESP